MGESIFTKAVTFPLEQTGRILRALSLSGGLGNAAAWVIFFILGIAPAGYLVFRAVKKRAGAPDLLMAVLSVILTGGLYLFINPSYFQVLTPMAGLEEAGKYITGTAFYSVGFGYLILRTVRSSKARGVAGLKAVLAVIIALLAAKVLFIGLPDTAALIKKISMSNTGAGQAELAITVFFQWFGFGVRTLSDGMDIAVLVMGMKLLDELAEDRYTEAPCRASKRLEKTCRAAVTVTVAGCIILNMAQLLAGRYLLKADYTVQIPLVSIAVIMAVMLGAGYLAEGKEIKEENDLFI
ncbi:hypothetical protein [Murimonas intestini]|uniref:DUF2975 domain-containing protein n=1 Tax=Murimonas intestini TaxID=1337051 RepID=A0AB73T8X9_9FIRM|nr:hypothetical protein [Murimonas intestini]MCR1840036.1 hypothetical protein [Murimonas intestini]MCR1866874.1 hypothetical protein [Murimonas intestini]MCR1883707.1 hypothetical protein [Murimonas intestini]